MKKLILPILGIGSLVATVLAVANAKRHLAVAGGWPCSPCKPMPRRSSTAPVRRSTIRPSPNGLRPTASMDPGVRFNYQSIGSGGGQKQLLNQTVDFGASDAPMTDEAMAEAPGKILHLPVVAGGVAIIYNLPGNPETQAGRRHPRQHLSRQHHQVERSENRRAQSGRGFARFGRLFPCIAPTAAAPRSSSPTILSSVNPAWADTVGKSTSVKWPAGIGLGAKGSEGVAGQVKQISGAIGYVELAYADQNKIPYADVKNSAGNFISPAPDSVSAALATAKIPDDFRFSMVNPPGDKAYPIAGASWVLVYQQQKNADHGKKLVAFLKWAVTDGQKISSTLDYAPLPDNVQQRELELIDTIKY